MQANQVRTRPNSVAGELDAYMDYVAGVDVKLYGAIGDGETDDSVAIAAAIAEANTTKKRLYFPQGHYMVDWRAASIALPSVTSLIMIGEGADTIIEYAGSSGWDLVAHAAWATGTAYNTLGTTRVSSGNIYQLITTGESHASTVLSGTGSDITDGTCHWKFIAPSTNRDRECFVKVGAGGRIIVRGIHFKKFNRAIYTAAVTVTDTDAGNSIKLVDIQNCCFTECGIAFSPHEAQATGAWSDDEARSRVDRIELLRFNYNECTNMKLSAVYCLPYRLVHAEVIGNVVDGVNKGGTVDHNIDSITAGMWIGGEYNYGVTSATPAVQAAQINQPHHDRVIMNNVIKNVRRFDQAEWFACGMSVNGYNPKIMGNHFYNIWADHGVDCEGLYIKSRGVLCTGNTFFNAGMSEGCLTVKGYDPASTDTATEDTDSHGTEYVITGNRIAANDCGTRYRIAIFVSPFFAATGGTNPGLCGVCIIANNVICGTTHGITVDTSNPESTIIQGNVIKDLQAPPNSAYDVPASLGNELRAFKHQWQSGSPTCWGVRSTTGKNLKIVNNVFAGLGQGNANCVFAMGIAITAGGPYSPESLEIGGNDFRDYTATLKYGVIFQSRATTAWTTGFNYAVGNVRHNTNNGNIYIVTADAGSSMAAWAQDTVYDVGDERVANGNRYIVDSVAGDQKSSPTGTGPTGTGTGIVDDQVTWDYVSAAGPQGTGTGIVDAGITWDFLYTQASWQIKGLNVHDNYFGATLSRAMVLATGAENAHVGLFKNNYHAAANDQDSVATYVGNPNATRPTGLRHSGNYGTFPPAAVAYGTGTIPSSGATSATILHGLSWVPTAAEIQVTPVTNLAGVGVTAIFPNTPSGTGFTVSADATPSSTLTFAWCARIVALAAP